MVLRRLGASGSWVRQMEHGILRAVSLLFSLASAYAIRLFFAPLDVADPGEKFITWGIALGFGILGYVVSRGLVHRMMQKESIWAYAPICFLVELVDIACNYVLAASTVRQARWLELVPENQRGVLTLLTYVVLSAIPLVSLFLAVVDMDLERSKQGVAPSVVGGPKVTHGTQVGKPGNASQGAGAPLLPSRFSAPGNANQGAGASGNGPGAASVAAAKRATYWNNQSKQPGQSSTQSSAKNLLDDTEKTLVAL
jgi:hypothetical protein